MLCMHNCIHYVLMIDKILSFNSSQKGKKLYVKVPRSVCTGDHIHHWSLNPFPASKQILFEE